MKACNCTYWERQARKMAKLHLRVLTCITENGVDRKTLEQSVKLALQIMEAKP